jgi:acyl-coenzyme A synthetase/AMP-(fatty) acid ligase
MIGPSPLAEAAALSSSLSARIRRALAYRPSSGRPVLDDGDRVIPFGALVDRCWIMAPRAAVVGRNVLIVTDRPLSAALALCSLDGLVARLVICPPDLDAPRLPDVIAAAAIDVVVHDGGKGGPLPKGVPAYAIDTGMEGAGPAYEGAGLDTQWALFTSGTTGAPKIAVHDLAGLTDAIKVDFNLTEPILWATFYDTRRFGGLQMLLRALTGGHSMIMTSPSEPIDDFIARLAGSGLTHLAGTPSHWRSALRHKAQERLKPRYVRLSGEIADQGVLDSLARAFPDAAIGHAYASTEAGVGFEVNDGLAGFPVEYLRRRAPVELQIRDGSLWLRSSRAAHLYLGSNAPVVADADGFVDSGDLIEQRGERLYFAGRANGVINVGGLKVHPEEVEAVINQCHGVQICLVKSRRSPITGALVAAEVVLANPAVGSEQIQSIRQSILEACRGALAPYKVPTSIKFVDDLPITASGKLERRHA